MESPRNPTLEPDCLSATPSQKIISIKTNCWQVKMNYNQFLIDLNPMLFLFSVNIHKRKINPCQSKQAPHEGFFVQAECQPAAVRSDPKFGSPDAYRAATL
jgi:hypothetical protein